MINNLNSVDVFMEDRLVGRLALSPDHRCVFEYTPEWLQTGFSISPFYIPIKPGVFIARMVPFEGLFGVFNDSLPDGWGKLLTDRWLMEMGQNPSKLTIIDRLSLVGSSGMGALIYRPNKSSQFENKIHNLEYYANEVEKILRVEPTSSLDELVNIAGSSGGARPKILIRIEGIEWLVKFKASNDPDEVGRIEYEHSLLAKKSGIEMPETRLFEGKYFGTRRFDRNDKTRIHTHSAAGLLYASHRLPSLDYIALMQATMALTRDIREVEKLFRQMVFNVIIGNKDDHAKNFSFIFQNNQWKLSPAYDLLPSDGFNNNHTSTVNGKGKPTIDDCLDVARQSSLVLKNARRIIDEVVDIYNNYVIQLGINWAPTQDETQNADLRSCMLEASLRHTEL